MVGCRVIGEPGPDLDPFHVRDDEQRRVSEVTAVLKQLVERLGEIRPFLLVLPPEVPLLPGIGKPVFSPLLLDPALRRERQPLGIECSRLGMVKQLAKVQEVLLRGGSLRS